MDSDAFERYIETQLARLQSDGTAFSKFIAHMKRLKPRTVDDLGKAGGRVCDLFKLEECINFFAADGYETE